MSYAEAEMRALMVGAHYLANHIRYGCQIRGTDLRVAALHKLLSIRQLSRGGDPGNRLTNVMAVNRAYLRSRWSKGIRITSLPTRTRWSFQK